MYHIYSHKLTSGRDISALFSLPTWVSNVTAIYRAGIVTVVMYIQSGTTGNLAQSNFVPSNFLPANASVGIASSGGNSADINKIISSTIDKSGALGIWISEPLSGSETVQFVYITKNP